MTDFEKDIRRAVVAQSQDPARHQTMMKGIREMYEQRMRLVKVVTWIGHAVGGLMMLWGLWVLVYSPSLSAKLYGAVIALIGSSFLVLVKLWYWVVNTKYAVLTEVKSLQVQVAELAEKLPASD
ncbi:MAG: hypothetical protein IMF16_05810 [Proteobacteria bacterium]|nr:hypothetical protein [Pseudomonadota bacterium]